MKLRARWLLLRFRVRLWLIWTPWRNWWPWRIVRGWKNRHQKAVITNFGGLSQRALGISRAFDNSAPLVRDANARRMRFTAVVFEDRWP